MVHESSSHIRKHHASFPRHFKDLRDRHGQPIQVLNLAKQRTLERQPRECMLGEEYERAVQLANRALSAKDRITYLAYDFSSRSKASLSPLPLFETIPVQHCSTAAMVLQRRFSAGATPVVPRYRSATPSCKIVYIDSDGLAHIGM